MALCEVKMPDEFLAKISRLEEKTDEILPKVLKTGGDVVLAKVKGNLSWAVGGVENSRSTGELISSIGLSPAKQDEKGKWNVKVGFNEPRRKQYERKSKKSRSYYEITNAMIANVIEHGKHNQPARPFLKPAKNRSRQACYDAMQAKFESEVKNL